MNAGVSGGRNTQGLRKIGMGRRMTCWAIGWASRGYDESGKGVHLRSIASCRRYKKMSHTSSDPSRQCITVLQFTDEREPWQ